MSAFQSRNCILLGMFNCVNMALHVHSGWEVALIGVYPIGHCSLRCGTSFRYRECAGGRRSLEAAVMKKAELWLVIIFL